MTTAQSRLDDEAGVVAHMVAATADRNAHDAAVLGDLLQPCDRGREFVSARNNYVWWHAVGRFYRPRRIAEIGTRFGYSLKALVDGAGWLMGDYAVRCWDAEVDDDREPLKVAETYFRDTRGIDFRAYRLNTRHADKLSDDGGPFDLVSVDGDHSAEGALADIRLLAPLLRPGGVLCVDDTNPGTVSYAVSVFAAETGWPTAFLPTMRGMTLLRKPD